MQRLAEFVAEGSCALFVGPDLGESASGYRGLPTSWQLADELAKRCDYRSRFRSLPHIAQIFVRQRGRRALVEYLRQRLGAPEYLPLPIHEIIARIPFPVIVSGGWDTLLEQAIAGQKVPFSTVQADSDVPFLRPGEQRLLVYKPYGSIEIPQSLCITESDQLNVFYDLQRVIGQLERVVEQYALLLVGYALEQDAAFARIYHHVRRSQAKYQRPAFAVQSFLRPDEADAWESYGIEAIVNEDPALFLRQLALEVARVQGRTLMLPDLRLLSSAPRLTSDEVEEQENVLNTMMDQIGVDDLIEQTNVPLLSEEQLRDIEAMRAAYMRLSKNLAPTPGSARIWLRQGNLEFARENYARARDYYQHALEADENMAEAYHNLHYVQLARREWAGALQSYWRAVELQEDLHILPDRYQIVDILGTGGLGVVYHAWDLQAASVAVKVLQRAKAQTEQVLRIFKREANILQSLDHPNIIHMLDFQSYKGNYFIVMDYLKGRSLKTALAERSTSFSLDETFRIIEQVCQALIYAHNAGVVHRDIKPSNIFLVGDQVILIDFGLARSTSDADRSTLATAAGTPSYAAPEQAQGLSTDPRTDIYGVASVCYELLTGRNPSLGAYRSPSEVGYGLDSSFDIVLDKARELDPRDRYSTMQAFLDDLRRVVAMQAASAHAPLRVRIISRSAERIKVSIERGWPIWLGLIMVLGLIAPAVLSAPLPREVARYSAIALANMLLLGAVARVYGLVVARRERSATIAAYGSGVGVVLSIITSIVLLPNVVYVRVLPEPRLGYLFPMPYIGLLSGILLVSLAFTLAIFLILPLGGAIARRLGRAYTTYFFVAYFLALALLLVLSVSGMLSPLKIANPPPP
jgi:serine/threonine-protein kinase